MKPQDIRDFRREAGMSQTALGEILGYSYPQVYISKIERGKIKITARFAAQIEILKQNEAFKKGSHAA